MKDYNNQTAALTKTCYFTYQDCGRLHTQKRSKYKWMHKDKPRTK